MTRQNFWDRIKFENEMIPFTDALYLHWKRSCWIFMWQQADKNTKNTIMAGDWMMAILRWFGTQMKICSGFAKGWKYCFKDVNARQGAVARRTRKSVGKDVNA